MISRSAIIHETQIKTQRSQLKAFYKQVNESYFIILIDSSIKGNGKQGDL